MSYGCCTAQAGYVKLNGVAVWQGSQQGAFPNDRGVNIIPIDPLTCSAQASRRFDMYASATHATELSNYLQQLTDDSVIVGVTGDDAQTNLASALPTLQQFGVEVADVQFRGSFAFIAQKGSSAKTVLRKILTEAESRVNPAYFAADIRGIHLRAFRLIISSLDDAVTPAGKNKRIKERYEKKRC